MPSFSDSVFAAHAIAKATMPRSICLDQAFFCVHIRSALTSAFAVSMSFLITATIATLAGFSAPRRASYLVLRSGLCFIATKAGGIVRLFLGDYIFDKPTGMIYT